MTGKRRVTELNGEWKVEPFPPPPVCWPMLDDEKAAEAMTSLQRWVTWLIERYGLDHRTVPICWAEHGALVEELSALHGAWHAAYAQSAGTGAPLEWHNGFTGARQRLTDWISRSGCRPGEHRPVSVDVNTCRELRRSP